MRVLIHHRVKLFDTLIGSYNSVRELFIQNSFQFRGEYETLIEKCLGIFKSQGTNAQVSEILNVQSMSRLANKGIHPIDLIKVKTGRNELKMTIAHHGLDKLHELITDVHTKESQKLEEAEEIISNLLLSLHQQGVLTDSQINELQTIKKIEEFWKQLNEQNGSISTIYKKLRLKLIPEDIFILTEKILLRIK